MKKIRRNSKKGFTLVELIVVLVILAILAAMLVPALTGYIDRAKKEKDYQTASVVYAAAQAVITEQYGLGTLKSGTTITLNDYKTKQGDDAEVDAVIALAGVNLVGGTGDTSTNAGVVTYSFTYDATTHVITSGSVEIRNRGKAVTYYLRADGSWGPTATATTTPSTGT